MKLEKNDVYKVDVRVLPEEILIIYFVIYEVFLIRFESDPANH